MIKRQLTLTCLLGIWLVSHVSAQPSPDLISANLKTPGFPLAPSEITANYLRKSVGLELDRMKQRLPPETFERIRAEVERCRQIINEDSQRLWLLVKTLRYLQDCQRYDHQPFDPPVQQQLNTLTDEVFDSVVRGEFGPVPFGESELRELCRQQAYKPVFPSLDPYFRIPISRDSENGIRSRLRTRLLGMAAHRQLMWMNVADLSPDDRRVLWRAFIRDVIQHLVMEPMMTIVNDELAGYSTQEEITLLQEKSPSSPVNKMFLSPDEEDRTEFDLLRTSNERVYSFALSLLPLLTDIGASDNPAQWRNSFINLNLASTFSPYTEISVSLSFAACKRWWIFFPVHIQSNDGQLLSEKNLVGRCFVYDADQWKLYEYVRNENRLSLMIEGAGQQPDGSVYFLSDYRKGDLLNALNCVNSLFRAWMEHDSGSISNPVPFPEINEVEKCFGRQPGKYASPEVDKASLTMGMSNDSIVLRGKQEGRRTSLTNATLPYIACSLQLAANPRSRDRKIVIPLVYSLFPKGIVIQRLPESTGQTLVRFNAPSRLNGRASVIENANQTGWPPTGASEENAVQYSAYMLSSNPFLNLRHELDAIIENAVEGEPGMDCDVELYLLQCLERESARFPEALRFDQIDLKIGLSLALGRRDDALLLLAKQARLLQSNTDRDFVHAYLSFYARELRKETIGATPSMTNLPCFLIFEAGREKQRQNDLLGGTNSPHFTINQQPGISRPNDEGISSDALSKKLEILAQEQYGQSKTTVYAIDMVRSIWEKLPECQSVSKTNASRIISLWQATKRNGIGDQDNSPTNELISANAINSLIWQTYHCLLADANPLTPEMLTKKASQLQRLEGVLRQLDGEAARQAADLPDEAHLAIQRETERCLSRLREYMTSPLNPLFYYPLHDEAFEKAVTSIEDQAHAAVRRFASDYSSRRKKMLEESLLNAQQPGRDVDYFQNALRQWSGMEGSILTSLTMGNIVRHYCIVERNLDYKDPVMFPFWKVNGIGVVYKMQEGLSVEFNIDWKLLASDSTTK